MPMQPIQMRPHEKIKIPDITGSIIAGMRMGLQAKQMQMQKSLADKDYVLRVKKEKRLQDETDANIARYVEIAATSELDRELKTKRWGFEEKASKLTLKKAQREESLPYRALGFAERGAKVARDVGQATQSNAYARHLAGDLDLREKSRLAMNVSNEYDRYKDLAERWHTIPRMIKEDMQKDPSSYGFPTPWIAMNVKGLDPDATKPIDLSTVQDFEVAAMREMLKRGDTEGLARLFTYKAAKHVSKVPAENMIKSLDEIYESFERALRPLVTSKPGKATVQKTEARRIRSKTRELREKAASSAFAKEVSEAAIFSGLSAEEVLGVLKDEEIMKLLREAKANKLDLREVIKGSRE